MRWLLAVLCIASAAWGQWIEVGDVRINTETFEIREAGMPGIYGNADLSAKLREVKAGLATGIFVTGGDSTVLYRGYGFWGALTWALDDTANGWEMAGTPFFGFARSSSIGSGSDGKSALYVPTQMINVATDSLGNNASAVSEFNAWQGSDLLADCVNVRDGVTITAEDAAVQVSASCSWFPATALEAAEAARNLTAYYVYGIYGGEAGDVSSWRPGSRNLNTTNNVASSTYASAGVVNDGSGTISLLGETTGATAIARASYTTGDYPPSAALRLYGTSEETTTGVELRLANFPSGPVGGRSMLGKVFVAGMQALRSEANAGNTLCMIYGQQGGYDYTDVADFIDTSAEQTAVQLRIDEMADNLGRRGDTRPVYVFFVVPSADANVYATLGDLGTQSQYNAQITDLFDQLKAIGDSLGSVDGWYIAHLGGPPYHTDNARNTAYGNYRTWAAAFAQANAETYRLQYANPVEYTDPSNSWTLDTGNDRGGELWYVDGGDNVHFNRDGADVYVTEWLAAAVEYSPGGGGWRSRARHPRTR